MALLSADGGAFFYAKEKGCEPYESTQPGRIQSPYCFD